MGCFIMFDYIYMVIQWVLLLMIRIPLVILGLILVPLGLLDSIVYLESKKPFTKYDKDKYWVYEKLPAWLWLWSNDRDGARGDKRGWWHHNCNSGNSEDFFSKFWWMAIRNPVNNMRFVKGISCNAKLAIVTCLAGVTDRDIDDKVGHTGFQLLKAKGKSFNYYHLYWVRPNKEDNGKALIIRMGHKLKLSYNDKNWSLEDSNKVWKGFTFRVGFNKDIT